MRVTVLFKSGSSRNESKTRKPISFEGHIVYCDGKSIVTENAYNGARQTWNFEKDMIYSIECI